MEHNGPFVPQIVAVMRITDTERALMLARWQRYMEMSLARLKAMLETEFDYSRWIMVAYLMKKDFGNEACERFYAAFETRSGARKEADDASV